MHAESPLANTETLARAGPFSFVAPQTQAPERGPSQQGIAKTVQHISQSSVNHQSIISQSSVQTKMACHMWHEKTYVLHFRLCMPGLHRGIGYDADEVRGELM